MAINFADINTKHLVKTLTQILSCKLILANLKHPYTACEIIYK